MQAPASASVVFLDNGSAIYGTLLRCDGLTAAVRVNREEAGGLEFEFGRNAMLGYRCPEGHVRVRVRMVAELDHGIERDLLMVAVEKPVIGAPISPASVTCSIYAAYRAVHDNHTYGPWYSARITSVSLESLLLLIHGHVMVPDTAQVQIQLPDQIMELYDPRGPYGKASRNACSLPDGPARTLRLRGKLSRVCFEGSGTVAELQLHLMPLNVAEKLRHLMIDLERVGTELPSLDTAAEDAAKLPAQSGGGDRLPEQVSADENLVEASVRRAIMNARQAQRQSQQLAASISAARDTRKRTGPMHRYT